MTDSPNTASTGIDGIWNLRLAAPIGEQKVRLQITHNGSSYVGTATQGSETVPFLDFELDGDRAKWHQHISKPFPIHIHFDLIFIGSQVSGTCKPGIFPKVKVTGQRADTEDASQ